MFVVQDPRTNIHIINTSICTTADRTQNLKLRSQVLQPFDHNVLGGSSRVDGFTLRVARRSEAARARPRRPGSHRGEGPGCGNLRGCTANGNLRNLDLIPFKTLFPFALSLSNILGNLGIRLPIKLKSAQVALKTTQNSI